MLLVMEIKNKRSKKNKAKQTKTITYQEMDVFESSLLVDLDLSPEL